GVVRQARAPGGAAVSTIDTAALTGVPAALQRAVLWRAMREVAGGRSIDFHHVEAARRLIEGGGGADARFDAPGQAVERSGGSLVLTGRSADARGRRLIAAPNLFRYPLSIPGEVVLADA